MLRGFPVAAPLLLALSLLAPCAALQLPSGSVTAVRRPAASTRAPLVQALEAEDEDEKAPAAAPAPAAPRLPSSPGRAGSQTWSWRSRRRS